jgi:hypothetical protein
MTPQAAFAQALAARCNEPCPATQDAIDRIVAGEFFRGRAGMFEALRGPHYTREHFCSALLSAWKPRDIFWATGRSRDGWLRLLAKMAA